MADQQWNPYDRGCPTREVIHRIGDRWTILVVGALSGGALRFSQIGKAVDGVSQKMLTQTLRSLERDGIVARTMYPQIPPRVEYELTEAGRTLIDPLRALENWAIRHMATILEAQNEYDEAARGGTFAGASSSASPAALSTRG
jgi:DNA-binding HxlR family transcriptional regulator